MILANRPTITMLSANYSDKQEGMSTRMASPLINPVANIGVLSAGAVSLGLETSLTGLRTDHVDLLQVHDIEFE